MADEWTEVREASDVTPEIIDAVYRVVDGWYVGIPLDQESLLYQLESCRLKDGTYPDLGQKTSSPAITMIMELARCRWSENNQA